MLINCDIGEGGVENRTDLALLDCIAIANIACGGHAGDAESARFFCVQALEKGVRPTLHLSYPDRQNFGRKSLSITTEELLQSLSEQRALLPEVNALKFHGALYNDSTVNVELAATLVDWLQMESITEILAPPASELAKKAVAAGIEVFKEGFAERRYVFDAASGMLALMSRTHEQASIVELDQAVAHSERIVKQQEIEAFVCNAQGELTEETKIVPLKVETLCIHSDSEIALSLAKALKSVGGTSDD